MHRLIYNSLLCILLMGGQSLFAQNSFPSLNLEQLNISHEFGNISINNSKNSTVTVELRYSGPNPPENLNDALLIKTAGSTKSIQTDFSGLRWRPNRSERLDLFISMPSTINLEINHRFGDVRLEELNGNLNLLLTQGNLFADGLMGKENNLSISFGTARLAKISSGVLKLNHAKEAIRIERAGTLEIVAMHSPLNIKEATNLKITSQFGDVTLGSIYKLQAQILNSRIAIGEIKSELYLNTRLAGKVSIGHFTDTFKGGELEGNLSQFEIRHMENIAIRLNVIVSLGEIRESASPAINWTDVNQSANTSQRQGTWGEGNEATLKVTLNNGNLILSK